jgi:hypothetical protein
MNARIGGDWHQCDYDDEKNKRKYDQYRIQGDFVWGLLPFGAFDQGNHPVQKRIARVRGYFDQDRITRDPRTASHGRLITSRPFDYRCRFACNR